VGRAAYVGAVREEGGEELGVVVEAGIDRGRYQDFRVWGGIGGEERGKSGCECFGGEVEIRAGG